MGHGPAQTCGSPTEGPPGISHITTTTSPYYMTPPGIFCDVVTYIQISVIHPINQNLCFPWSTEQNTPILQSMRPRSP